MAVATTQSSPPSFSRWLNYHLPPLPSFPFYPRSLPSLPPISPSLPFSLRLSLPSYPFFPLLLLTFPLCFVFPHSLTSSLSFLSQILPPKLSPGTVAILEAKLAASEVRNAALCNQNNQHHLWSWGLCHLRAHLTVTSDAAILPCSLFASAAELAGAGLCLLLTCSAMPWTHVTSCRFISYCPSSVKTRIQIPTQRIILLQQPDPFTCLYSSLVKIDTSSSLEDRREILCRTRTCGMLPTAATPVSLNTKWSQVSRSHGQKAWTLWGSIPRPRGCEPRALPLSQTPSQMPKGGEIQIDTIVDITVPLFSFFMECVPYFWRTRRMNRWKKRQKRRKNKNWP